MATRKKAKSKTKATRKKPRVTKAATRRKTKTARKKPVKKAPVRRASPKKARPTAKAAAAIQPTSVSPVPPAATPPAKPTSREERIGVVTHYSGHLPVATMRLESGTLCVGDVIHIHGHSTDFSQRVESLEVNHAPATEVGPNDDFGLKVVDHAREHDVVYKVRTTR